MLATSLYYFFKFSTTNYGVLQGQAGQTISNIITYLYYLLTNAFLSEASQYHIQVGHA